MQDKKQRHKKDVQPQAKEYVAILRPGSSLVALTAAGRPPSSIQFTPFLLAIIGTVLCSLQSLTQVREKNDEGVKHGSLSERLSFYQRLDGLSGSDPLALLHAAHSALQKSAVGRFARHISTTTNKNNNAKCSSRLVDGNPLLELHTASTDCGITAVAVTENNNTFCGGGVKNNGDEINTTATHAQQQERNLRIADNSTNCTTITTTIVDHSVSIRKLQKRQRDEELGGQGDCPKMERMSWKWTGRTSAAHDAFRRRDDGKSFHDELEIAPMVKFKCGVVMEGSNIFEGLRALVSAGVAHAPLPNFVKDAPMLGTNTVTVLDDGSFHRSNGKSVT